MSAGTFSSDSDARTAGQGHWFPNARYGLFVHWGPYAKLGRGEQVLFREHLDQAAYSEMAVRWSPRQFDAEALADFAVASGMKYVVFTARHHDGYCLWDSAYTEYTSSRQMPGRDFVQEYVEACRSRGLRIGIYYSLADWRARAYWSGAKGDPVGWRIFRNYVHNQVEELLSNYGKIDVLWFDGAWPHSAEDWRSADLLTSCRQLQPSIIINNRVDTVSNHHQAEQAGGSLKFGDFHTPEHNVVPSAGKWWEACKVTSWRLWGYAHGERYKSSAEILDALCECASQGGNLLMNVGLDAEGRLPDEPRRALLDVGQWLKIHGDAIYGTQAGNVSEFVTYGYQTRRAKSLYLIYRFWPGTSEANVAGVDAVGVEGRLLGTTVPIDVRQTPSGLVLSGLPGEAPVPLFPVIELKCPQGWRIFPWAKDRLWQGDPARMNPWVRKAEDLWPEFVPNPVTGVERSARA